MSKYPPADSHTEWFEDSFPGALMHPNVLLLHTTEGLTWPTYLNGSEAPNYTAMPNARSKTLTWRQHFPDERSSRALVNAPGGVETNTLNVIQVELVGTCDPAHALAWGDKRAGLDYIFWPQAPDWLLSELAKFVAYCHNTHGIRFDHPVFEAYPKSFGTSNGVRFTGAQWESFFGICGHQHAPENVHGDPGDLDVPALVTATKALTKPAPAPAPTEDVWFYNLREGRPNATVANEIRAILGTHPLAFGVCEAAGYDLPSVANYTLIRDKSKAHPGRANIALYVAKHVGVKRSSWADMRTTWHRTDHPGTHPARSYLKAVLGNGTRLVVCHQPPPNIPNVAAAQEESTAVLEGLLKPSVFRRNAPTIAIGDFNTRSHVAVAQIGAIAQKVGGLVVDGRHIDTGIVRNLKVASVAYPQSVGGVKLRSDHKHALHFTVR